MIALYNKSFFIEKFKDRKGFQGLIKSPYLIPNNLKKWEEFEFTPEILTFAFLPNGKKLKFIRTN